MLFYEKTEILLKEYLRITGRPAYSVSPDEYLRFRESVIKEYKENSVPHADIPAKWEERKEKEEILNPVSHGGHGTEKKQRIEKPETAKITKKSKPEEKPAAVAYIKKEEKRENGKDRMLSMMKAIQG